MFRELCFFVIFLNSFHYNVKLNGICMARGEINKGIFNGIWKTVQKYYGKVKSFLFKDVKQEQAPPHPDICKFNKKEKKPQNKDMLLKRYGEGPLNQNNSDWKYSAYYGEKERAEYGSLKKIAQIDRNNSDTILPSLFEKVEQAPPIRASIDPSTPFKNKSDLKFAEYFESEENATQYKEMEGEQILSSYQMNNGLKVPEFFDTDEKMLQNLEDDDEILLRINHNLKMQEQKERYKEMEQRDIIEAVLSNNISRTSRNTNYSTTTKKPRVIAPMKPEMSAAHLISSFGFKSETHSVLTSDGYMLTMHRIRPDADSPSKQAVILHHGLLGSSEDWLILGPGLGLPYLLVDKGYDVWLLNARGNKYSRGHTTWYTESYEFWDFSWHEMGAFDLPATLTYITDYTQDADIYFIGHSMGASALLALLSSIPEYNDMIKSAIFLGPLAFMYKAKGPLKQLAEIRRKKGVTALSFLGTNEFLPSGEFPLDIVEKFCKGDKYSCQNSVLLLTNGGKLLDEDLMKNIYGHVPSGGSAMTILHYLQLVKSGSFQMYDYGVQGNLKKYKRKYPPKYDLEAITLPISLFTSPSDWLSSMSDVTTLLTKLKNVYIHHVVKRNDFGHMDFVWAKDAPELVFNLVIDILEQISPMKDKKSGLGDSFMREPITTDDEE